MVTDTTIFWLLLAGLVVLVVLCIYLFADNVNLRAIIVNLRATIQRLTEEKDVLVRAQAALIDVFKDVLRAEIRTARDDQRAALFSEALQKLHAIERDITVNVSNVGSGAQVGQVSAGTDNTQAQ